MTNNFSDIEEDTFKLLADVGNKDRLRIVCFFFNYTVPVKYVSTFTYFF